MNEVCRDERRQRQDAKQPDEPVTREEATDTRRPEIKHHHRNQIEVRGVVNDVPADEFGDKGAGHDGIQQVESHRYPGGLECEEGPLSPTDSFQDAVTRSV
jgi:hypothetical protein